jgi:hypothetical protein
VPVTALVRVASKTNAPLAFTWLIEGRLTLSALY